MKDTAGRVLAGVGSARSSLELFSVNLWYMVVEDPNTHPGLEIGSIGTAFPVAWTGGGAICIPQELQMNLRCRWTYESMAIIHSL